MPPERDFFVIIHSQTNNKKSMKKPTEPIAEVITQPPESKCKPANRATEDHGQQHNSEDITNSLRTSKILVQSTNQILI